MNARTVVALLLALAAGTAAGAEHLPVAPEAAERVTKARTVALVVTVVMRERGASGKAPVRRPQWEPPAREAFTRLLAAELERRGLGVRVVEVPPEKQEEIGDVVGILNALRACAGWYGTNEGDNPQSRRNCTPVPPGRRTSPGVGSLGGLASDVGADTIVLLAAVGTNSTAALSVFGWFAPGGSPISTDLLSLAILAPTGSIDWLSWTRSKSSDLREVTSVASLLPELLEGAPLPPPVEARP